MVGRLAVERDKLHQVRRWLFTRRLHVLIVKGSRVRLHLKEGGPLVRPSGAMMHDPTGRHWPKSSLLIGPFTRGSEKPTEAQYEGAPKEYLGRKYNPHVGSVDLPPLNRSAWIDLGEVERIDYVRPGTKAPGGFRHEFGRPRGFMHAVHLVKGKRRPMLYRFGRFYRLDLGPGAILDDRGIAFP